LRRPFCCSSTRPRLPLPFPAPRRWSRAAVAVRPSGALFSLSRCLRAPADSWLSSRCRAPPCRSLLPPFFLFTLFNCQQWQHRFCAASSWSLLPLQGLLLVFPASAALLLVLLFFQFSRLPCFACSLGYAARPGLSFPPIRSGFDASSTPLYRFGRCFTARLRRASTSPLHLGSPFGRFSSSRSLAPSSFLLCLAGPHVASSARPPAVCRHSGISSLRQVSLFPAHPTSPQAFPVGAIPLVSAGARTRCHPMVPIALLLALFLADPQFGWPSLLSPSIPGFVDSTLHSFFCPVAPVSLLRLLLLFFFAMAGFLPALLLPDVPSVFFPWASPRRRPPPLFPTPSRLSFICASLRFTPLCFTHALVGEGYAPCRLSAPFPCTPRHCCLLHTPLVTVCPYFLSSSAAFLRCGVLRSGFLLVGPSLPPPLFSALPAVLFLSRASPLPCRSCSCLLCFLDVLVPASLG